MEYELVLWDLDGTLIDTSPGVFFCLKETFQELGIEQPPAEILHKFIGPPLTQSLRVYGKVPEEKIELAVTTFKGKYRGERLYMANVYDKIEELLARLKADGVKQVVATLKPGSSARDILEHTGLLKYFDAVCCGSEDESGNLTKADLIRSAMDEIGMHDPFKMLLIGDSDYDAQGAQECRIDFAAALYGFGFTPEQARDSDSVFIAEAPGDLADLFYISDEV